MKRGTIKGGISLLILGVVAVAFYATARPAFSTYPQEEEPAAEKKLVYMRADRSYSIDVGDSMAVCMVGNFAAMHNGAVITCDSAVRYDGQYFECFGNVLINQNTTYVYGDRADYDGRINKVEVYSPLVKVIDGDAVLYTRRFIFDTYTQVGEFSKGGTLFNRGNQLEADEGFYFSDTHELACRGNVEMRDSNYLLSSDSVRYNTDTDYAYFFRNTRIWNSDNDYLEGDEGYYARPEERYVITKRSYILTETNEMWSDSLDYHKPQEQVILYGDIQLDDTEQKALAFGDYGEYYKEPGSAILTRNPALVNYDTSQGSDTLFMRSDTILLLTFYTNRPEFNPWEAGIKNLSETPESDSKSHASNDQAAEAQPSSETKSEEQVAPHSESNSPIKDEMAGAMASTAMAQEERDDGGSLDPQPSRTTPQPENNHQLADNHQSADNQPLAEKQKNKNSDQHREVLDSHRPNRQMGPMSDSMARQLFQPKERGQQAETMGDSVTSEEPKIDSAALLRQRLLDSLDTLSVKAQKAYYKGVKRQQRDSVKAVKLAERNAKLQIIARARQAKITAQLNRFDSLERVRLERRRARMAERLEAKRQRAIRRGKELPDSTALSNLDSLIIERERRDSLSSATQAVDSLATDSLAIDSLAADSVIIQPDTIRRITKGYRNVRIYRSDFQAVCDSLIGLGIDSTLHLYRDPILWNQQNQVTSDIMDIYTVNQAIDHVNFVGRPILVTEIDTMYYNQISGKEMTAWFANNQIYRHDVNGNVETIYFLQDDPEAPVSSVFIIKSGTASFYMEDQQVVSMTYREQNEYSMMPMDKIPASQQLFLKEYKWLPERRPTRDSVLQRTIRPSQRKAKQAMSRPTFPLTSRILRQRDNLLDSGKWADRDEQLSYEVIEWVRRNGFEPSQPRKEF